MVKKLTNPRYLVSWLLYAFAFALPLQTRWIAIDSTIQFQQISLYGFDILALILILVGFLLHLKKNEFSKKSLIALVGLIVIWSVIGLFWSANPQLTSYWIMRLIVVIGLIWIVRTIDFEPKKLAWALIIAISLQALLGIGQFLMQDDLITSKWLGASEQIASNQGTAVIETDGGRWLRAHGTQPHPNVLGGLILVGLALVYYLKIQTRKVIPLIQKSSVVESVWLNVIFLLLSAGLFFTFSRSAWLVSILLFLAVLINNKFNFFKREVKVMLPAIILIVALASTYHPIIQSRFSSTQRLEQQSVSQRLDQLEQAQNVIQRNIIIGTGLGNYTYTLQEKYSTLPAYAIQPVHNIFLLIISELGIVGLLIFLLIIRQTIKQYDSQHAVFVALFVGLLIVGLFDHYIWTLPSFVYLFWLITSLIYYRRLQE